MLSMAVMGQTPSIGGCEVFPASNIWNTRVDHLPLDKNSAAYVETIGAALPLVPDAALRERFLGDIIAEFQRTREELGHFFAGEFTVRRPRLAFTLDIREQPLSVLHAQQIELLRSWRGLIAAGDQAAADAMIPDLLISINALASGLRTTG